MDSSFTPIEQMLKFRASRHEDFPYQEILLTRLCMHMQSKLLENRNKMLKAQGINETLFMALITLESQENHSIQPSELSCALGSSRTNATRIADEPRQPGGCKLKTAPVRPVVAARPAEYVCSEDL
ncbi:transcriptional repressor MprA, partial [Escherichia coli]